MLNTLTCVHNPNLFKQSQCFNYNLFEMDPQPCCSSNCAQITYKFPFKSSLCLFCGKTITTNSFQPSDNGNRDIISQSTFLQAMSLLCENFEMDHKFAQIEQWAIFGLENDNIVKYICCKNCAILLQSSVEINRKEISKRKASLKSKLHTLANHIIDSHPTTKEYCINASVQFREEIIKKLVPTNTANINKPTSLSKSLPRNPNLSQHFRKRSENDTNLPKTSEHQSTASIEPNKYPTLNHSDQSTSSKSQDQGQNQVACCSRFPTKISTLYEPVPGFDTFPYWYTNYKQPMFICPPIPSVPSPTSPYDLSLMYFNVPIQKNEYSIMCLYPSCTFVIPHSYASTEQCSYYDMRCHILHTHRSKSAMAEPQQFFYCPICLTRFYNRKSYLDHQKSIHQNTPSPPVLCPDCGETLPSNMHLEEHNVTHRSAEERELIY